MACFGKLGLLACLCGTLIPLQAQKVVSARAGLVTYLQGPASINGKRVAIKIARFQQMRDGETLSTGRGRAEVLLAPGVVLRLAENSQVLMEDTKLSDTRITILQGEALIEVVQFADGNRLRVGVGETTTEFTRTGLYRFSLNRLGISREATARGNLRVYGGEALVRSTLKTAEAKRGMAVTLDGDLEVSRFDRKQKDPLHSWAAQRSFQLFMSDPETRDRQSHWQSAGSGYIENKNFGVEFRAYLRPRLPPPASRPPIPTAEHP